MKLAFSAPDRDIAERRQLLARYPEFGFEGLQLKRAQYDQYLEGPERFLTEWEDRPGVASGLITGGDLGEGGLADLRRVIAFGAAVGSERVVFCHGVRRDSVSDADIERFAVVLAELGREARHRGVQLSLHHHYDQPVMHRRDLERFFAVVQDRDVTLTVDTAHLVKSGIDDVAGVIRDFAGVIDNFHIKDFAGGAFVPLGQGTIDFAPVFAAIRDIGYDGWLCADEESGVDPVTALAASHRFLSTMLATA